MIETLHIPTRAQNQMVDITAQVRTRIQKSGVTQGQVIVYVPHTTAGVTINENADPDVQHDMLRKLDELVPRRESYYRHAEGNSDSHVKASMMGFSATIFIADGDLLLGQWQGIYLCEFDGPRTRQVFLKIISD